VKDLNGKCNAGAEHHTEKIITVLITELQMSLLEL